MSIQLLTEKFDKFITESAVWRSNVEAKINHIEAQNKCLGQHFYKYKPQLEEGLNSRKWWSKFWEDRRQELITYTVRGGGIALLGLVVYALSNKFITWVRSSI